MATELVLLIILVIAAYLLGSVPAAYLVAKWARGIDIRKCGSGNVGAGNLVRTTSWQIGLPVIIFDLGKGLLFVWIAHRLELAIPGQVAVGIAAIVGHNWPLFLRFNGGRGMLTTIGVFFILPLVNGYIPWEIVAFLACAVASFFTIHSTPIGVGAGVAISPLVSWGTGKPLTMILGFLAILLIVLIRRLTFPRSAEAAGISQKELIINRVFLDRDIRDKQAWINRTFPRNEPSNQSVIK